MSGLFGSTWKWARRCAIAMVGGTVVLVGICMLVLPGPGIVVIPAGLAILSLEFAWARLWLRKVRAGQVYAVSRFGEKFRKLWRGH
jgi:uncharacterized protein (TIGR02611 family)